MFKFGVVTSYTTSLRQVAETIVYALEKLGYPSNFYTWQVHWKDAKRDFERAIIFIPFDPTYLASWVLLQRDYMMRGIPSITYVTLEGKPKKWLIEKWIKRDGIFVANSQYTYKYVKEQGMNVIGVIPHGINLEETREALKETKKQPKPIKFGTVATNQPRKGLKHLAKAIKIVTEKIKDIQFEIVTTIGAKPIFHNLPNTILNTQYGMLSRHEILSKIASWHYYVCSSHAEGFCLPVLEAQALGLPVIFPEYDPLTEITHPKANFPIPITGSKFQDQGYGILFEIHDYKPDDLAKAIIEAYNLIKSNEQEYNQKSKQVKKHAEKFEATKVYKKFLEI